MRWMDGYTVLTAGYENYSHLSGELQVVCQAVEKEQTNNSSSSSSQHQTTSEELNNNNNKIPKQVSTTNH